MTITFTVLIKRDSRKPNRVGIILTKLSMKLIKERLGKKMFKVMLLLCICTVWNIYTTTAQNKKSTTATLSSTESKSPNQVAIQNESVENQLVQSFGTNYDIHSTKVRTQLIKNIENAQLSYELRKESLKLYYGDDYINKIYLIQNKTK